MTKQTQPRIAGLWKSLIGACCKIVALPVGGYSHRKVSPDDPEAFTPDTIHTISGEYSRVTSDGHIYPVYELAGIPGRLFKPSEIWITSIPPEIKEQE